VDILLPCPGDRAAGHPRHVAQISCGSSPHVAAPQHESAHSTETASLDGDGDADIAAAIHGDTTVSAGACAR
jgi:hypothetical protein